MIGELIVAFCEKADPGTKAVELWAYPDGTMNLVVAWDSKGGGEHSFGCTLPQLQGVLDGKDLHLDIDQVRLSVAKSDAKVCAKVTSPCGDCRQCIDIDQFQEALDDAVAMKPALLY